MILFDRGQPAGGAWLPAAVPLAAALAVLGFLSIPRDRATPSERAVPFSVVRGIVDLRCGSCHSQKPADKAFPVAAAGIGFDKAEEIAARAATIRTSTVLARSMPPGNSTRMTDEERALFSRWIDQGARISANP